MAVDWSKSRVVVTGGAGFLGTAVCERLRQRGCLQVLAPRRRDFDLTREEQVERLYREHSPDLVVHLAAEVGGIGANREHPGRFFHANLAMGMHLIEHARRQRIQKFVVVGTACSYPENCPVPFREEDLWGGYPEPTNAPYGIAKKSLFVMLDAYYRQYGLRSAALIPANLYGPGDRFDPATSHVVPALIRKCVEAAETGQGAVHCWGTGKASREFLFVDDAAEGILTAAETVERPDPINLGTGQETRLADLVQRIADLTGFGGRIEWDPSQPDGQLRRALDPRRARSLLGWSPRMSLDEGLMLTIDWYRHHCS